MHRASSTPLGLLLRFKGSLVLYYTLTITFEMKEKTIIKYWEPFGLLGSIWPLAVTGNIMPTGYLEPWCTIHAQKYTKCMLIIAMVLLLSLILLGFTFIICRVAKIERELKKSLETTTKRYGKSTISKKLHGRTILSTTLYIHSMQSTRVIFVQALTYVISFLITLSMPIARQISYVVFAYRDKEQCTDRRRKQVEDPSYHHYSTHNGRTAGLAGNSTQYIDIHLS